MDPCDNPPAGSQLETSCSCKKNSQALEDALKIYTDSIEENARINANNQKLQNDYNTSHSKWKSDRDAERSRLSTERKLSPCEWVPVCKDNGWHSSGNNVACPGISGWSSQCYRDPSKVDTDILNWDAVNKEPVAPSLLNVTPVNAPTGINIVCCSQIFENISADSLKFENLSQECSIKIDDDISKASDTSSDKPKDASIPNTVTPNTVTSKPVTPNSDNLIIKYAPLAILIIIILLIL